MKYQVERYLIKDEITDNKEIHVSNTPSRDIFINSANSQAKPFFLTVIYCHNVN